jgi:OFA family oxalate/formate antiporter-like MFS transporter
MAEQVDTLEAPARARPAEGPVELHGPEIDNHGWRVTFAGMGINLALGVLYSWSIISGGMEKEGWGWTQSQKSLPYSIACLVFCLIMVPAGRMQDRLGPRLVATIGGLLVGVGMLLASVMGNSHAGYIIGFGVLAGAGIGFGYASATPPAVKWFPRAKTGLIAGLVVSGFGLASVYVAPLATWLIATVGLSMMVMILGLGFLVVVVGLAQLLKPPPAGFVAISASAGAKARPEAPKAAKKEDFTPREMLRTWQFYLLWFMYACGAGAGLMIISVAKKLGKAEAGVIAVVSLAIGNGAGRIVAGVLSDKLGRKATLALFFILQAVLVMLLSQAGAGNFLGGAAALAIMAALIGANYGANLSLFPSITKDFYGLKNFGANYGLVFTAWGVGGFMLALLAGKVYDGAILASMKGSFAFAYYCSAALLVAAAVATFLVRTPHHKALPSEA